MFKTNAMRLLDQKKIKYKAHDYSHTDAISGMEVAGVLGLDPARVFKTLVTAGKSGEHYVFIIPVNKELDLKKAAASAGEKAIEMIKTKELLPLTGYVHGGCSPIGMKKLFRTFIDISAREFNTIIISAGKIGYQIELEIDDLREIIPYELADLVEQNRFAAV